MFARIRPDIRKALQVERYRRLHPVVNEVLTAAELPIEEKTTRPHKQIIFEASDLISNKTSP